MIVRLRTICCIAASLALMGLPAAPAAVVTENGAVTQMPCDGDMPDAASHQTDCSQGCDTAPADNQLGPDWAPPASRPVLKDLNDMLAPAPAFRALIPPTADPHHPRIARAPPPLATNSPVTRADRLLN